tara:strand:- start:136 stop:390 length:255 start_codon:yes stop_codon:yes gene_type:complete
MSLTVNQLQSRLTYAPDGTLFESHEFADRAGLNIIQTGKAVRISLGSVLHQENLAQRHYATITKLRKTLEKRKSAKKNDGDNRQ